MTDSMIERVARVICCPNGCHIVRINERAETARHYASPWPCCWQQKVETARAAIEAMRETTPEIEACFDKYVDEAPHWDELIDAILSENP
jgi:hypothetical protein